MHLRNVPVNSSILGKDALGTEPSIKQVFITGSTDTENLERTLYIIRKRIENRIHHKDFYIVSLSSKNIVYKGMLSSVQVREFFPDLTQPYFTSGLAVVHSRFSTNTFPTWSLAQLSACWRITVKSTPYGATELGWRHGKACSPHPRLAT